MTRPRRRALIAIGLGEFVDAYDLIVISGAFFALQSHFRLSSGAVAWVQAAAFFGSAVGALFFGDIADRIGRRRVFVLKLIAFVGLVLVVAAVVARRGPMAVGAGTRRGSGGGLRAVRDQGAGSDAFGDEDRAAGRRRRTPSAGSRLARALRETVCRRASRGGRVRDLDDR